MSTEGLIRAMVLVAILPLVISEESSCPLMAVFRSFTSRWKTSNVYKFNITGPYGEVIHMTEYKDHPLLIINIPYEVNQKRIYALNLLMTQYYDKGLRILAFPSEELSPDYPKIDQFKSPATIKKMAKHYHMRFDILQRATLNGPNTEPLLKYLKTSLNIYHNDIIEDYTMFIVDKKGKPVIRLPGEPVFTYEELETTLVKYM